MKRALFFAWICLAASAPAFADTTLRCETSIPVTMVDSMDSAKASPGERFRFKTIATVRSAGTLIPKGTVGYGFVREVSAASNRLRNGSLVLEPRQLVWSGKHLPVMADPRESTLWAPATTMVDRASGYLPIPGIVRTAVGEVTQGKNVTIGPGFRFHVLPLNDRTLQEPCTQFAEGTTKKK